MINMNIDYKAAMLHYEPEQIMKYDVWIGDCRVTYGSEASVESTSLMGRDIMTHGI